jgi:hypothetical protein
MSDQIKPASHIGPLKTASPVPVLKVQSIKLPQWTGKDIDIMGMSDAGEVFTPGIQSYGEGEIDVIYLAAQNAAVKALRNVPASFVVTYSNGQIDTWTGWINSFGVEIPLKEKIMVKLKVRANTDVISTGTTTGTVPIIGLGTTLVITAS